MLSTPRVLVIGVPLVVLWIFVCYEQLAYDEFKLSMSGQSKVSSKDFVSISKEDFIAAAITSAVEDDFDCHHIKQICDDQPWDNTVVFTCHGIIGGIGNIRQELLHCIRFAIDAGAGLVVPVINLRSESNLSDLENGTIGMDYLFDQDRFMSRMKTACPQMPIYKDLEEIEKIGPVTQTEVIKPKELPHWPTMPAFSARSRVKELKVSGQISLIPFERVWQHWPICHDSVGFADTFGNLIPFRQDVHRLAATILYSLHSRYHLPVNPSVTTTLPSANTFLGIHLRTANDILSYWLGYRDQADYYLSRIDSSKFLTSLPIVYIASGNATSVGDFSVEADSLIQRKTILTKYDLLSGADREELDSFTWDQQALVDELVLSRSAFFMGMADSSFAWTIAVQRRKTTKAGSCSLRASLWKSHLWGSALRDEFSDLMGNHEFGWEDRMWP